MTEAVVPAQGAPPPSPAYATLKLKLNLIIKDFDVEHTQQLIVGVAFAVQHIAC